MEEDRRHVNRKMDLERVCESDRLPDRGREGVAWPKRIPGLSRGHHHQSTVPQHQTHKDTTGDSQSRSHD